MPSSIDNPDCLRSRDESTSSRKALKPGLAADEILFTRMASRLPARAAPARSSGDARRRRRARVAPQDAPEWNIPCAGRSRIADEPDEAPAWLHRAQPWRG